MSSSDLTCLPARMLIFFARQHSLRRLSLICVYGGVTLAFFYALLTLRCHSLDKTPPHLYLLLGAAITGCTYLFALMVRTRAYALSFFVFPCAVAVSILYNGAVSGTLFLHNMIFTYGIVLLLFSLHFFYPARARRELKRFERQGLDCTLILTALVLCADALCGGVLLNIAIRNVWVGVIGVALLTAIGLFTASLLYLRPPRRRTAWRHICTLDMWILSLVIFYAAVLLIEFLPVEQ